mgnify:CR=1 FL=1
MDNKSFLTALTFLVPLGINAQIIEIPMQPTYSNTLEETVSGISLSVNTAISPYTISGAKGLCWRLDGYSSFAKGYIDLSELNGKSQLTFSLWVAPESYPMMRLDENGEWFTTMAGSMRINDDNQWDNTSGKGFSFQLGSRGTYMFTCFSNGFQLSAKASQKLNRYEWNHLVAVFDGTKKTVKLYNNGTEVASAKCGNTFTSTSNELFIGKSYTDVKADLCWLNTFNGLIDNLAVYEGINNEVINDTPENSAVLTYSADRYAGDICRPAFHGMPTANWTNETHGAVYYNGKFHLFFQKNPNGMYLSHMHWGHLVSDNLYKWEEMPTAISPGDDVTWYDQKGCWSGCVYMDDELTGGKPNIFYTGVDYARAMIAQATPADETLTNWEKMQNNPVIDGRPDGLSDDFRDCFVFKNNGNHYMIVGSSKNGVGCATLHKYDNGTKKWSNDGSIFFQGLSATRDGNFWEMPNVTKMGDKWMFTCTPLSTDKGVHTLYWIGDINDDGTFTPDNIVPKTIEMDGFSRDGYGMLSPTIFQKDDKTLMLGVVPDKLGIADNYRLGYVHAYSLPREISLAADGSLVQKPYDGLAAMRTNELFSRSNFTMNGNVDLSPVEGRSLELDGEFCVGSNDFGFTVLGTDNQKVIITYSPIKNSVCLNMHDYDRIVQDKPFGGIYESVLPKKLSEGQTAKLKVFVDHSFIDIFVNDMYAASVRIFPNDASGVKATVFGDGDVKALSVNAYILDANQATGIGCMKTNDIHVKSCKNGISYDTCGKSVNIAIYDIAGVCVKALDSVCGKGIINIGTNGLNIVRITDKQTGKTQMFKIGG